jgi:hypothetical protein
MSDFCLLPQPIIRRASTSELPATPPHTQAIFVDYQADRIHVAGDDMQWHVFYPVEGIAPGAILKWGGAGFEAAIDGVDYSNNAVGSILDITAPGFSAGDIPVWSGVAFSPIASDSFAYAGHNHQIRHLNPTGFFEGDLVIFQDGVFDSIPYTNFALAGHAHAPTDISGFSALTNGHLLAKSGTALVGINPSSFAGVIHSHNLGDMLGGNSVTQGYILVKGLDNALTELNPASFASAGHSHSSFGSLSVTNTINVLNSSSVTSYLKLHGGSGAGVAQGPVLEMLGANNTSLGSPYPTFFIDRQGYSARLFFNDTDATVRDVIFNQIGSGGKLRVGINGTPEEVLDVFGQVNVRGVTPATSDARIFMGVGRSATGGFNSLDMLSTSNHTSYSTRLSRGAGQNSNTELRHRGTGVMRLIAENAGSIELHTSNTSYLVLDSSGGLRHNGANFAIRNNTPIAQPDANASPYNTSGTSWASMTDRQRVEAVVRALRAQGILLATGVS